MCKRRTAGKLGAIMKTETPFRVAAARRDGGHGASPFAMPATIFKRPRAIGGIMRPKCFLAAAGVLLAMTVPAAADPIITPILVPLLVEGFGVGLATATTLATIISALVVSTGATRLGSILQLPIEKTDEDAGGGA